MCCSVEYRNVSFCVCGVCVRERGKGEGGRFNSNFLSARWGAGRGKDLGTRGPCQHQQMNCPSGVLDTGFWALPELIAGSFFILKSPDQFSVAIYSTRAVS